MSYQKIIIVGNLGKEPEQRLTPTGQAVTSFSVAVNEQYKNANGETVKRTIWFRVSVWGNAADACKQYLNKGSLVLVDGQLTADPATGAPRLFQKQDKSWGAGFDLRAQTVRFLSKKEGGADEHAPVNSEAQAAGEDSIPF